MEVNLDGGEAVVLRSVPSVGAPMSKVQRVAIAAIALETHDPAAISRLTGIKKKQVKIIVRGLLKTDWCIREVESWALANWDMDLDANMAVFAILNEKGVAA